MKKFTLILGLALIIQTSVALCSKLTLSTWDNSYFTVVIDNHRYNTPSNYFEFNQLRAGKHYIEIIKQTCSNNINYLTLNGSSTRINQVVYSGYINIPFGDEVIAILNRFNSLNISNVCNHYQQTNNDDNYYSDNYYNSYSYGINNFNRLVETIRNKSFDDTKMTIAKQAIASNGVTSQQVYELMLLLTFESNKISLAKYAYEYTVDKNNYYIVNDAFTFNSSINSLDRYINDHSW